MSEYRTYHNRTQHLHIDINVSACIPCGCSNDAAPNGADGKSGKFRRRFQFNKKPNKAAVAAAAAAKSGHSPVLSSECIVQMRKLMEFLMQEQSEYSLILLDLWSRHIVVYAFMVSLDIILTKF